MIKFSDPANLLNLIKMLMVSVTSEVNSVVECIHIKQVESKRTILSSTEPGVGYYTRNYLELEANSYGDTIGEEYLIDCKELKTNIESVVKGRSQTITLRNEEGELIVYGDLSVRDGVIDDDTKTFEELYKYKHRRPIRLYNGDLEDFKEANFARDTIVGEVYAEDFNSLIEILIQFGSYTGADEKYDNIVNSQGRSVRFCFDNDSIQTFNQDKDRILGLNYSTAYIAAMDNEEIVSYVEGRVLYRAKELAADGEKLTIRLVEEEDDDQVWLRIEGARGTCTVRTLSDASTLPSIYSDYLKAKELSVSEEPLIKIEGVDYSYKMLSAYVTLPIYDLLNGLAGQHTETQNTVEELVLAEKNGVLVIFNVLRAAQKADSNVDLIDYDGVWSDICVDYKYATATLKALDTYMRNKQANREDRSVKIYQTPLLKSTGTGTVRLVLTFFTATTSFDGSSLEIRYNARPAIDKLREIGINT